MASVAFLIALSRQELPDIRLYIAALFIGSAFCAGTLWRSGPLGARVVFLIAAALHLAAMLGRPAFEDDYYRFLLDGWRLLTAGTPYGLAPQDLFAADFLPAEIERILDNVNNPHLPTIYGPALEIIFAVGYLLSGSDPWGLRALLVAGNLILIGAMLRRFAPERVALYAWSPFVIAEIVIHLHADGMIGLLLFAGVSAHAARRPGFAGAALGAAAACKLVALAAWPILLFMPRRAVIAAAATLGGFYAPFLLQSSEVGFGAVQHFAANWRFNPLGLSLLDAALPAQMARLAGAGAAALVIAASVLTARRRAFGAVAAIFCAIIFWSPAVNPWYALWALPLAVATRCMTPYAIAIAATLSYLNGLYLGDDQLAPFEVHPIAHAAESALIALALIMDAANPRLRRGLARRARIGVERLSRARAELRLRRGGLIYPFEAGEQRASAEIAGVMR